MTFYELEKTMSTTVATTSNGKAPPPTIYHAPETSEIIDPDDIIIPKIIVTQGSSMFVKEGKCKAGDLVKTGTGEVIGSPDKPIAFIPLTHKKFWILEELNGKRWDFRSIEAFTKDNCHAPIEFTLNNAQWRRNKALNFFVLLPDDIKADKDARIAAGLGKAADASKALMPYVITFKRSGYRMGKVIATHFSNCMRLGLPTYSKTFKLGSTLVTGGQNTWNSFKVDPSTPTPEEYYKTCKSWYDIINNIQDIAIESEGEDDPTKGVFE